jgi:hypothetical protein
VRNRDAIESIRPSVYAVLRRDKSADRKEEIRSSFPLGYSFRIEDQRRMQKSGKFRRSAVVTLTITTGLAAAGCCDRATSPEERARRGAWWRFWHNESWCGTGYRHGYTYFGSSRGMRAGSSATARGGFGGAAHAFSGG